MSKHSHNAPGSSADAEKEKTGTEAGKNENAPNVQGEAAKGESAQAADAQNAGVGGAAQAAGGGEVQQEVAQPAPEEKIADLEAKLAEANDQYLRKAADFENFRKRMVREKQDAIDYANQSLLLDLIQTMDDFERALKAAETTAGANPDFASFYEGVSMIEKRLSTQLENKWGLKRFDSVGQPFDPNRHEAMMMEKSAETPEPVVKVEYSKGYTLKERVVRPAKVVVTMPDSPGGAQAEGSPQGETAGAP
jgi:molecular chaperone GrpE